MRISHIYWFEVLPRNYSGTEVRIDCKSFPRTSIPLKVHWAPISLLLDTHDTSANRLDLMDGPDNDNVILWLLPHKGEGFDGAAFATSMPQNKSRFVAAHHQVPKQRHITREERGGTELPVEYGLLQNTDCFAMRFSDGARTSVGVVGGCAANADLAFQDIPGISKYHFAITFDDLNRPIV